MSDIFKARKAELISKIDRIAKESFNNEQKIIAKQIIETSTESNIESVYQFVTQRVKTGFVFDAAPEVNHNAVSILNENNGMYIDSISNPLIFNEHILIIGENYDALKNLLVVYTDPISGKGLIDVIYIDPPYNTESAKLDGNDYKNEVEATKFLYRDKFSRDGWLNMMNERLKLAHRLLKDSGVIFVSINDTEQAYLKILLDEIFGEKNFITTFVWKNKSGGGNDSKHVAVDTEQIHTYSKNVDLCQFGRDSEATVTTSYNKVDENGRYALDRLDKQSIRYSKSLDYEIVGPDGTKYYPKHKDVNNPNATWRWGKETVEKRYDELVFKDGCVYTKNYEKEDTLPRNLLIDERFGRTRSGKTELKEIFNGRVVFDYPKPSKLIRYLLSISTNKDSLVLDFFAGSGTTGHAVMDLNENDNGKRRFILVTNNENRIGEDIARERLYRVINGKGSNGEGIEWIFSNTKRSFTNNKVRVFGITSYELSVHDFEKARSLLKTAQTQLKLVDPNFKLRDSFSIYNEMASLNPYKAV